MDICGRHADEARWIVSANWAMSQLATEKLGVFIPKEGGEFEAVTKEYASALGIPPDRYRLCWPSPRTKKLPKRPQAIRLLELYGSLDAALADASSAPLLDWKRARMLRIVPVESSLCG